MLPDLPPMNVRFVAMMDEELHRVQDTQDFVDSLVHDEADFDCFGAGVHL